MLAVLMWIFRFRVRWVIKLNWLGGVLADGGPRLEYEMGNLPFDMPNPKCRTHIQSIHIYISQHHLPHPRTPTHGKYHLLAICIPPHPHTSMDKKMIEDLFSIMLLLLFVFCSTICAFGSNRKFLIFGLLWGVHIRLIYRKIPG